MFWIKKIKREKLSCWKNKNNKKIVLINVNLFLVQIVKKKKRFFFFFTFKRILLIKTFFYGNHNTNTLAPAGEIQSPL